MSRLISLTVTDFKRLKAARIQLHPGLNKVVGPNGAGKSSLLDSLAALLSGTEIPDEPIRTGAEAAEIVGETEDLIIRRKITAKGNTLVIESKDKTRKFTKPQDLLDSLTGGRNSKLFDPGRFLRQSDTPEGRREQAVQLRQIVGLDFTEIDAKRATLYSQRTLANAAADQAEAHAMSLPYHENAPTAEVSAGEILSAIDKANEQKRTIEEKSRAVADAEKAILDQWKRITEAEAKVTALEAQLTAAKQAVRSAKMAALELEDKAVAAKELVAALEPAPDITPLRAKLATIEADNAKARDNAAKKKAGEIADQKRTAAKALDTQITALDKERQDAMTGAKFPIAGLSFDDTGVRYQGKPFTQASDAEKLRVAVAIYAARKPELRCMVLRSGSLLDDASLVALDALAEQYGLQILIEVVQHSKDDDVPEGAIVVIDGEASQGK